MASTDRDNLYTVAEVAEMLNVSKSTVRRWIRAGKLTAYHVGSRRLRIRMRDLENKHSRVRNPAGKSLSLDEARLLAEATPSTAVIARRSELFDEIQRTRKKYSIAPLTSDELVRLSRERSNW